MQSPRIARRPVLLVAALAGLLALAVPVIAADPSPAGPPDGPPQTPPGRERAEERGRPDKGPEIQKTLGGTVEETTDDLGRPTFTVTVGGTTWELSAGPKWFHGDKNPLKAFVGESVEIAGTYHEGETELDVLTIDGEAIRAEGRPPWAGGPWEVGESHPGWQEWMADGKPGNGLGREHAPGQQKDEPDSDE